MAHRATRGARGDGVAAGAESAGVWAGGASWGVAALLALLAPPPSGSGRCVGAAFVFVFVTGVSLNWPALAGRPPSKWPKA